MITVKPNELKAIALAASKEETRYYLGGVFFECYKGKKFGMVATDGHRLHSLAIAEKIDEGTITDSFILATRDIKRALDMVKIGIKAEGKRNADTVRIFLTHKEGALKISVGAVQDDAAAPTLYGAFDSKAIDGTFPDVRRVIPSRDLEAVGAVVQVNAKLLGEMAEVAELLKHDISMYPAITIHPGEVASDALIITIERTSFKGVLMPIRR